MAMQNLAGFRDFPPEDCAKRNYIFATWRQVARRYGFVEYDGPTLEHADLYAKKNESGAEILQQLYQFTDKGDRPVALRPEMTPTLARMVAARERLYRKPLKWFSIANFFRYERQQKGRLREFVQLNCDLIGESGAAADAEVIALLIDLLRSFGFTEKDFVVRLSNRSAWLDFFAERRVPAEQTALALQVVDKIERESPEALDVKLAPTGLSAADIRAFIDGETPSTFTPLLAELEARGLSAFVEVDLSIVRGLAYYTGIVFEAFDRSKSMRALAGGGRYDDLIGGLSDGAANLSAIGFGMGDVVLANLVEETPHTAELLRQSLARDPACDVFIVLADDSRRADALGLVQTLRERGHKVDFSLSPAKVGKQFQAAENLGARRAVVIGQEWPLIKVKTLADRQEATIPHTELAEYLGKSTH